MLEELNEQQRQAACYDGDAKNILVVAGAGCGKTKTMVSRAYFLQKEKEVSPERILCLTFTNKAAKEIVSRLKVGLSEDAENMMACTFHSFCIKVIKQLPQSFDYQTLPTIIDQSSQLTLMKGCLGTVIDEYEVEEEERALIPKAGDLIREYSYARNSVRSVEKQFRETLTDDPRILEIALSIIEKYEEEKQQYYYVDFDDILIRFVEVAERKPELAKAISGLFDEVLVDELQDTNPIQYRVLKLLAQGDARMFAVGDPAQSIYGFRGADFKSIYGFEDIFSDSVRINLFVNYRSSQEILDVSNALLSASTYNYDNKLKSATGYSGQKAELHEFDSTIEEAIFIARDIVKHIDNNGNLSDIFIITRSAFSAKEMESALNRFNIPYEFIGGMSINKTAHVQDLLSVLKLITNKKDKLSCMRFLSLFKGVGDKTAVRGYNKLCEIEDKHEFAETIANIVKKDSERAKTFFLEARNAIDNGLNPIRALLEHGFEDMIKDKYPDKPDYRINDIKTVAEFFKQYNGDIETFISDFTLEPAMNKMEDPADEEDKITLITAHSAKGLECDICYSIGASPGSLPSTRSIGKRSNEEEERRVAYVAWTRPRKRLVVTRTMEYMNNFFRNAKTNIDFVDSVKEKLATKGRRRNVGGLGGLGSLSDVF